MFAYAQDLVKLAAAKEKRMEEARQKEELAKKRELATVFCRLQENYGCAKAIIWTRIESIFMWKIVLTFSIFFDFAHFIFPE